MQQVLDKFNFSIILKPGDVEASSEYWQEQCCQLYGSLCSSIPDDWIEPLKLKCSEGKRADLITIFSTVQLSG